MYSVANEPSSRSNLDIPLEIHLSRRKGPRGSAAKGHDVRNGLGILSAASGSWLTAIIFTIRAVCH